MSADLRHPVAERPPAPGAPLEPRAEPGPKTRPDGVLDSEVDGPQRSGFLRTIIEIVVIVTAAFVIALLVQAFLVKPFTIHQVSMRPTLEEGDRILLNRLSYHFREPARGDVIVFHSPINADEDLVKRIVAVGGDRVAVTDGRLYLNEVVQEESYLLDREFSGSLPETVVPLGEVFVMGDNRNNSGDSRLFGSISEDSIIGSAFVIYWPIGRWGGL